MLYTATGHGIQLGQPLGSGGQGVVYEVERQPYVAAKRYHAVPAASQIKRLQALVERYDERLAKIAAWPTVLLHDAPGGQVVGFMMSRVDSAAEVHTLHSPKSRLQKFPDATWAFLIHTASNIARAVATMHEAGFVIGDVNPKNILVSRQATVALLDCDSYQFETADERFVCEAGFPEYTPPELQGVVFREITRSVEHDAFGLAVVIFQLLFLGRHPFSGKYTGEGEMPIERAIREGRLAYGPQAPAKQMHQPPGTLPWAALPDEIAHLFERSFLTTERATPHEWIAALDQLAQALTTCESHPGHRYHQTLAACPWCDIEQRARVKLFNVTRKLEAGQRAFHLVDIWREIEEVGSPALMRLPTPDELPVEPSAAALRVAQVKRNGFILALLVAAVGGFSTAYLGGFCAFVGLSWLALFIANACLKLEPQDESVLAALPASNQSMPALLRIEAALKNAEANLRQLEQRWNWDINGRFIAKRNELQQQAEHYAALDATRADRLSQLENAAKQDLLQTHLQQFEIKNSEVGKFLLTTTLRFHHIQTAADITPERLETATGISRAQTHLLLNWRKQKEDALFYDPAELVHPALRERVLTETEAMRERLEAELRSGPLYLRRLRTEAETAQFPVLEQIKSAQTELAQAQADFKVTGKRKSLYWPTLVLLAAGLVAGLTGGTAPILDSLDIENRTDTPQGVISEKISMNADAFKLFNAALEKQANQDYKGALSLLAEAQLKDGSAPAIWDELSYTQYLAGNYDRAIRLANDAPHFGKHYRPYKNLALAYAAKGKWSNAKDTLNSAITLKGNNSLNNEDVELRYLLGQSLKQLGQLPEEIAKLENTPDLVLLNQIKLACFHLWNGDKQKALAMLQTLKDKQAPLTESLENFIKNHSPAQNPKQSTKSKKSP